MDNSNEEKRKHFMNGIQVPDEVAQIELSKPNYTINDSEALETYNDFIAQQKAAFKAIIHYFNDMLTKLKEEGKISDFMEFRARIKAPESALHNDPEKALNDVFGMEFIGATETEVQFILSEIDKKTVVTNQRSHNKDNGYKAEHRSCYLNEQTQEEIAKKFGIDAAFLPLFECQFKTIAVAIEANTGTAAHINYKGIDPEEIQKKYDRNEFMIGYNIPQMWVSSNGQMRKLSSNETLKKLYPFLDITKKKGELDRNS